MVNLDRRLFLGTLAAFSILPHAAAALTTASARALVDKAVAEINQAISAGGSDAQMIARFRQLFDRYADEPAIAASVLGRQATARASRTQRGAFSAAFRNYITAKYGRRFREFIGGQVIVTGATARGPDRVEVDAQVRLRGEAPFAVTFYIWERTGRALFYDLSIEGVRLLSSERAEIGALLDRNRGNLDAVIAALRGAT